MLLGVRDSLCQVIREFLVDTWVGLPPDDGHATLWSCRPLNQPNVFMKSLTWDMSKSEVKLHSDVGCSKVCVVRGAKRGVMSPRGRLEDLTEVRR